jgi:hypothetical protein
MAGESPRRSAPAEATRTRTATPPVTGPGPYYAPPRRGAQFQEPPGGARPARPRAPVAPGPPRASGPSRAPSPSPGRWPGPLEPTQPVSSSRARRQSLSRQQPVRVARDARNRWTVRRVNVASVFKVSVVFYLCVLAVALVAGAILWNVAESAGLIDKLDKLVRSLFALSKFQLHPLTALLWGGAFVASLCLLGVLANVFVAVLYNVLSDLVGGVRVVVVNEAEARAGGAMPRAAPAGGAMPRTAPGGRPPRQR